MGVKIIDPFQKRALKAQINEFGQVPMQIFNEPHIPRRGNTTIPPEINLRKSSNSSLSKSNGRKLSIQGSNQKNQETKKELEIKDQLQEATEKSKEMIFDLIGDQSDELDLKNIRQTRMSNLLNEERYLELLKKEKIDYLGISDDIEEQLGSCGSFRSIEDEDAYHNFIRTKKYKFKFEKMHQQNQ